MKRLLYIILLCVWSCGFSATSDNFIEIVSKADNKFIKYDLLIGEMLVCRYSDDMSQTLQLQYRDFKTVAVSAEGSTDDFVERLIALSGADDLVSSSPRSA